MPSRTPFAALAVASTAVVPIVASTAPCDCWASLPVSNEMVLSVPEMAPLTRIASVMLQLLGWRAAAAGPVPSCRRPGGGFDGRSGRGQLAADPPPQQRGFFVVPLAS